MSTSYAGQVRALRMKRGDSQAAVAERLGMTRQAYLAVEKGARELTLEQAQALAELYGVSLEELSGASVPQYEKYKQMILAYLAGQVSPDGRVPKTKLAKLLYLADFAWYYEKLDSMSGMLYLRRKYGPVPDPYFRALAELEEEGKIVCERKGDATLVSIGRGAKRQDFDLLSAAEKKLIARISERWRGRRTQEIVDFTHEQLPYKICAPDEVIPYELITQEDPVNVF